MRRHITLALILTAALLNAAVLAKEEAGTDRKKIQGNWKVVRFALNGVNLSQDMINELTFMIKKKEILSRAGARSEAVRFSYKLEPGKKPKTIDTIDLDGVDKGKVSRGIYLLDGDTLKLCMAEKGTRRPTEFTAKKGSKRLLIVLRRARR